LILFGKLILGTKVIKEASFEVSDDNTSFRDRLEECLIGLCKELDIQVPLWLKKNTKEFVQYRTTFFTKEQFVEDIKFDKFELRAK
jgi:hypothetical protein